MTANNSIAIIVYTVIKVFPAVRMRIKCDVIMRDVVVIACTTV